MKDMPVVKKLYIFKTRDDQIKLLSFSGNAKVYSLPPNCPTYSYFAAKWWLQKQGYEIEIPNRDEIAWGRILVRESEHLEDKNRGIRR